MFWEVSLELSDCKPSAVSRNTEQQAVEGLAESNGACSTKDPDALPRSCWRSKQLRSLMRVNPFHLSGEHTLTADEWQSCSVLVL